MDLILSGLLLILLAPVMLGVALSVALSSPGPILFCQRRPGLGGKSFLFLKFRSMYAGHEGMLTERQRKDLLENGILPKSKDDRRITPVGRFLRRTSLDELPQLVNVFLGDMSLVGPRPVLPDMLRPFPEIALARTRVRPGITGLWQVLDRGRSSTIHYMWPHDKQYIEANSFWLDLRILLATVRVVLSRKGAC